ncbi:Mitochondrial inner membrane protease ATP23 [Linum perenne]
MAGEASSFPAPMVKFLREHLEKAGCGIGDKFIRAVHCDGNYSGGFTPGKGIQVCSNHMNIQDEVNQVVIHELIHAFDECRAANLDWTNCAHHACSEVSLFKLIFDLLASYVKSLCMILFLFAVSDSCSCFFVGYSSDIQIRAGHLSGDCNYKRELLRGFMKIRGHEQECVRRRVMKSLMGNPYCSEAAGKDAMEAIWDVCYNDTQPFDRAP